MKQTSNAGSVAIQGCEKGHKAYASHRDQSMGSETDIIRSLGFDVSKILALDERQATLRATAVSLMSPTSLDATTLDHNGTLRLVG